MLSRYRSTICTTHFDSTSYPGGVLGSLCTAKNLVNNMQLEMAHRFTVLNVVDTLHNIAEPDSLPEYLQVLLFGEHFKRHTGSLVAHVANVAPVLLLHQPPCA